MSKRQTTEAELRLVAGVCGGVVFDHGELLRIGWGRFDPLYNYADLARFVSAMQGAGWRITRCAEPDGCFTIVFHPEFGVIMLSPANLPTDLEATYYAIVDALKEQEEHNAPA